MIHDAVLKNSVARSIWIDFKRRRPATYHVPAGYQAAAFFDASLLRCGSPQLAVNVGSLRCRIFPEPEVDRTRHGHRENGAHDPKQTCCPHASLRASIVSSMFRRGEVSRGKDLSSRVH
jgi:hypothetical protein